MSGQIDALMQQNGEAASSAKDRDETNCMGCHRPQRPPTMYDTLSESDSHLYYSDRDSDGEGDVEDDDDFDSRSCSSDEGGQIGDDSDEDSDEPSHIDVHDIGLDNLDISFSGCGFLGIYHVGVVTAFHTLRPDISFRRVCGASAGAIVATALAGGVSIETMITTFIEACAEASAKVGSAMNPGFDVTKELRDRLDSILPDDIHLVVRNRLFISMTEVYHGKNVMTTYFESKEDLIEAICASSFIPVFSGYVPLRYQGSRVIDGGFTINLPRLCENTIRVSPFAGRAHICPPDNIKTKDWDTYRILFSGHGIDLTINNLIRLYNVINVPGPTTLSQLLIQGFQDGFRFLRSHGLVDCHQCMEVTSYLSTSRPADDHYRKGMRTCKDQVACDRTVEEKVLPPKPTLDFFNAVNERWGWWRHYYKEVMSEMGVLEKKGALTLVPDWRIIPGFVKRGLTFPMPAPDQLTLSSLIMLIPSMGLFWGTVKWLYEKFLAEQYPLDAEDHKTTEMTLIKLAKQALGIVKYIVGEKYLSRLQIYKVKRRRQHRPRRAPNKRKLDVVVTQFGNGLGANSTQLRAGSSVSSLHSETDDENALFPKVYMDLDDLDDVGRDVLEFTYDAPDDDQQFGEGMAASTLKPGDDFATANQLQLGNLLSAIAGCSRQGSRVTSRVCSRVASRAASRATSRHSSRASSRRGSTHSLNNLSLDLLDGNSGSNNHTIDVTSEAGSEASNQGTNETLSNIISIAESHSALLSYYFHDEDGRIVARSLYDVSGTDAAEIVGQECLQDDLYDRVGDAALDPLEVHEQLLSVAGRVHPDRLGAPIDDPGPDTLQVPSTSSGGVSPAASPVGDRRRLSIPEITINDDVEPLRQAEGEDETKAPPGGREHLRSEGEDVRSDPESDWDNNFSVSSNSGSSNNSSDSSSSNNEVV